MEQNPKQQEVLIARNNETGEIGAVVGQNPDGTPKMADVKSASLSDLVKFSKGQNPIEAFLSNFIRQAKNPTKFGFFKVLAESIATTGVVIADLLKDPEANKTMLDDCRVEMPKAAQRQSNAIDESKIDWAGIEKEWGITREQLEKTGDLKNMLYNRKSQLTSVSSTIAGEKFDLDARLSFKTREDGSVTLVPHFVHNKPNLDAEYKGYTFTQQDKEALMKDGNLGRAVDLKDPATGEVQKSLVSLDRITNEIESIPLNKVFIKNKIGKTELSMSEIGKLKNGGIVEGKEIELNNGRKFTTNLQYNAEKRDVEFLTHGPSQSTSQTQDKPKSETLNEKENRNNDWTDENGNPKKIERWCKKPLTAQQTEDYLAGKQIVVTDVKDRYGNDCTVYVQWDPDKKMPKSDYVYPDKSKVVGVAEESKTQVAVNDQGKTNEATKNVGDPLKKGQTEPKDDAQKAQQKKPKGPKL